MPVFSGNTTGSVLQVAYGIPSKIVSFSLSNKAAGNITVYLAIRTNNGDVTILPDGLVLAEDDTYTSDVPIVLPSGFSIFITTSGSLDYFFSIE